MKEEKLKELTTEQLNSREQSFKAIMIIFAVVIMGLIYFPVSDLLSGKEVELSTIVIIICSFGGLASLFPEFSAIRKEIAKRNN